MALDTTSSVTRVETEGGDKVPPATDEYYHEHHIARDVTASPLSSHFRVPGRASTVTVHVETSGAASVAVASATGDDTEIAKRASAQNGDYSVDSSGQIFVETAVTSPYMRVEVSDDSGAANDCDITVYAR